MRRRPNVDARALSEIIEAVRRLKRAARLLAMATESTTQAAVVALECREIAATLESLHPQIAAMAREVPREARVTTPWLAAGRQYRKAAIRLSRAESALFRESSNPRAPVLGYAAREAIRRIKLLPDGDPWRKP